MIRRLATSFALAAGIAFAAGATAAQAGSENGNFMVRLQGTYLSTSDNTKSLFLDNADVTGAYKGETPNLVLPTATLTYFFNKNFAAELFCCFAKTDVDIFTGAGAKVGNAAETWMFPPIVTLQYHFTGLGAIKPYVGAGVQYIHYFSSKTGDNVLNAQGVKFGDSFGPAIQAGFDMSLGGGWYLNADVKKSWLDTKITWSNGTVPAAFNTLTAKHDLDPVTISVGVGYRFNLEDLFGGRRSYEPMK